jgi:hypothetical protein
LSAPPFPFSTILLLLEISPTPYAYFTIVRASARPVSTASVGGAAEGDSGNGGDSGVGGDSGHCGIALETCNSVEHCASPSTTSCSVDAPGEIVACELDVDKPACRHKALAVNLPIHFTPPLSMHS